MKPRRTFVCACCRITEVEALAVDYKPHRGPVIRICANCESVLIGYGEESGMRAIHGAAVERDTHLVQAGMLMEVA